MCHKGRCFRDRRKTKRRKMKQLEALVKAAVKNIMPTLATALTEAQIPEKEVSLKRRSW